MCLCERLTVSLSKGDVCSPRGPPLEFGGIKDVFSFEAAALVKSEGKYVRCLFHQANPNELTNGVINSAFMLLFKDSIRLFAAYNEGVINLLGNAPGAPPRSPPSLLSSVLKRVLVVCLRREVLRHEEEPVQGCAGHLQEVPVQDDQAVGVPQGGRGKEASGSGFVLRLTHRRLESLRVTDTPPPRMEGVVRCSVSRLLPLLRPNPLRSRSPPDRDGSSSGSPSPGAHRCDIRNKSGPYGSKLNPQ